MSGISVVLALFGFFEIVYSVKALDVSDHGLCLSSQHSCSGIACIQQEQLCDGTADCADGSDEEHCAPEFPCQVGKIPCKTAFGMTMCGLAHAMQYMMSTYCTGCGEPPKIDNGNVILKEITEKSAIGTWGKVMCNDGYGSCTSMIRCLPSGVWTTATCEPVP